MLGTRAATGTLFQGEDFVPDGAPVVVLSHAFWERRFASSPDVVGSTFRLNGRPYTVVGVAERGFQGTSFVGADMWVPFSMTPHLLGRDDMNLLTSHGVVWHLGIARLAVGASRMRIVGQLLTETLALVTLGGLASSLTRCTDRTARPSGGALAFAMGW